MESLKLPKWPISSSEVLLRKEPLKVSEFVKMNLVHLFGFFEMFGFHEVWLGRLKNGYRFGSRGGIRSELIRQQNLGILSSTAHCIHAINNLPSPPRSGFVFDYK
jgi:hypothetical protein